MVTHGLDSFAAVVKVVKKTLITVANEITLGLVERHY